MLAIALPGLGTGRVSGGTLTVSNTVVGSTPERLGYNLGHFMPGSNALNWFRYSGADAARIFINVSDIEPTDDLAPVGDGVSDRASFFARRSLLRTNAASTVQPLDPALVNWLFFSNNYDKTATGNNRLNLAGLLPSMQQNHVAVLANITASPSRFPITSDEDWPGKWELWQHYYAQAFLLGRDYNVQQFGAFNEPNGWAGMTEEDWLRRFLLASDAIQSAQADANLRYGTALVPRIFAPNTANGSEKYNTSGPDEASTDTWGRDAINARHLRLDGSTDPAWLNLHVYNYQKYTTRTHPSGSLSGYVTDFNALRGFINADMPGEPVLPLALTEFNVRTGANYDLTTATQDSPLDYAALGANCVALTERGAAQLYLFKFGQTASDSTYGVAKNGTHYVQNGSGIINQYGGATKAAEVYRLFCKASRLGRPRLAISNTADLAPSQTAGVWSQVTHDAQTGFRYIFLANKETAAVPVEINLSAWSLPENHPVIVEEVSQTASGGIVRLAQISQGRLSSAFLPAQSIQLISIPPAPLVPLIKTANADIQPGDGPLRLTANGTNTSLTVRSDGTPSNRHAALIRFPLPAGHASAPPLALLQVHASTTAGSTPVQIHVYGTTHTNWQEASASWASLGSLLRQNVPAGSTIAHNVVTADNISLKMVGQLVVSTSNPTLHSLDVTEFVRSSPGPETAFLFIQEHRWDVSQPTLTTGDIQSAGVKLASREDAARAPTLLVYAPVQPWKIWQQAEFPATSNQEDIAGPSADPDADGLGNLLEYALNGDPDRSSTTVLPRLRETATGLQFELTRQPAHRDLRCTVQISTSLAGSWEDAAVSLAGQAYQSQKQGFLAEESGTGPIRQVICTDQRPNRSLTQFYRLQVELLDP